MKSTAPRTEENDILHDIAIKLYYCKYQNWRCLKATGVGTSRYNAKRANQLIDEALAICGDPYYRRSMTRWNKDEQEYLDGIDVSVTFPTFDSVWYYIAAPLHLTKEECYRVGVGRIAHQIAGRVVEEYRLVGCPDGAAGDFIYAIAKALYMEGQAHVFDRIQNHLAGLVDLSPDVAMAITENIRGYNGSNLRANMEWMLDNKRNSAQDMMIYAKSWGLVDSHQDGIRDDEGDLVDWRAAANLLRQDWNR